MHDIYSIACNGACKSLQKDCIYELKVESLITIKMITQLFDRESVNHGRRQLVLIMTSVTEY